MVEVVYQALPQPAKNLDDTLVAGIDLGLDNLVTITSNKMGFSPLIVNGFTAKVDEPVL